MGQFMRVGLDISQAVKHKVRGIARYIREILPPLLEESARLAPPVQTILYARGERIFRREAIRSLAAGERVRWMPLRSVMASGDLGLFHSFGNYLPAISRVPLTFTVPGNRSTASMSA